MLGNISNENLISGNPVNRNENVQETEQVQEKKNIYSISDDLEDSSEISEKAKEFLRREQEIEHFKSMVLDSPINGEELNAIMELIRNGEFIDNKDLVEAMYSDEDLLSYLFGGMSVDEAVS